MLKKMLIPIVIATVIGLLITGVPPKTAHAATLAPHAGGAQVEFYRLLGPNGCHFYTASASEAVNAIVNLGYTNEGNAGYIFPASDPYDAASYGLSELYRLVAPNGCHFYTADFNEASNAVTHGYTLEGNAGWVCVNYAFNGVQWEPCQVFSIGFLALYRLWKGSTNDHFYTENFNEANYAVAHLGYTYEGIAAYVG